MQQNTNQNQQFGQDNYSPQPNNMNNNYGSITNAATATLGHEP